MLRGVGAFNTRLVTPLQLVAGAVLLNTLTWLPSTEPRCSPHNPLPCRLLPRVSPRSWSRRLAHAASCSRSTPGFLLHTLLPSACFAITSVRKGRDRQGGFVGAAKSPGAVLGRDKGRCVSSVTISDGGITQGRAAFQRTLLLPRGGDSPAPLPKQGGAQEPGSAGSLTCPWPERSQPQRGTRTRHSCLWGMSSPSLAMSIPPGHSVGPGNTEGAGLEPPHCPGSGCKAFPLCPDPAGGDEGR